MDLLIHDIAIAIERDAAAPPAGHWAWNATRVTDDAASSDTPASSSDSARDEDR